MHKVKEICKTPETPLVFCVNSKFVSCKQNEAYYWHWQVPVQTVSWLCLQVGLILHHLCNCYSKSYRSYTSLTKKFWCFICLSEFQRKEAVQHCKLLSDFSTFNNYAWYLSMLNYIWVPWTNNIKTGEEGVKRLLARQTKTGAAGTGWRTRQRQKSTLVTV